MNVGPVSDANCSETRTERHYKPKITTGTPLHQRCCLQSRYSFGMGRRSRRRAGENTVVVPATKPPGARIARVAVNDATWEAFRAACAPTPASVRLGQLVEAEVQRTRAGGNDPQVTLREVRERLDALERSLSR